MNLDPQPALLHEWLRLREEYNALDSETDEAKAIWDRFVKVEAPLHALVATTREGMAAHYEFLVEEC